MNMFAASWEDEENNRIVELSVAYRAEADGVAVHHVTPKAVTFLCPQTKSPLRRIGVRTESGRRLLRDRYAQHVGFERLEQELSESLLATTR